ncbi:MAG: class II aldolase, partial [Zoogloea sp.]|nr:class II aldolase [Zoogloea sp.]
RFGGADVRCAPYATFGTQALSDAALAALEGRSACLLGHHGMLVLGRDLEQALALAIEFETLCEHYWRACQLGEPPVLPAEEMAVVLEKFRTYGRPLPAGEAQA